MRPDIMRVPIDLFVQKKCSERYGGFAENSKKDQKDLVQMKVILDKAQEDLDQMKIILNSS